jgi:hypothetical protein
MRGTSRTTSGRATADRLPGRGDLLTTDCVTFYHDLLASGHADSSAQMLTEHVERHDVLYKASCPRRVLRPLMVDERIYQRTCAAAGSLRTALAIAADRLALDTAMRRAIAVPEYLDELIAIDAERGRDSIVGRFDGFIDRDGRFQMIEYNSAPRGIHVGAELNAAFDAMPIAKAFAKRYQFRWINPLDRAFDAVGLEHRRRGEHGAPVIGIVADSREMASNPDDRWLPYLAARGCRVLTVPADGFSYDGHRLRAERVAIDLMHFVDWVDLIDRRDRLSPILDAVRDDRVRVIHGISRGLLCSYKNSLEVLSDGRYRHLFDRHVVNALDRHVPWTRVVRDCRTDRGGRTIELLAHVSDHKDELVLKPSGGAEGRGVLLGAMTTQDHWDGVLRHAHGNYVVQDVVSSARQLFPVLDADTRMEWTDLRADCGPYVWNGTDVSGWLVRTTSEGLHNISSGAMNTPVWIVSAPASDTPRG